MDIGRNDPCHCGSGKKYKKCCEEKDQAKAHKVLEKQWTEAEKEFAKSKEQEAKEAAEGKTSEQPGHVPPKGHISHSQQRHTQGFTPKFNLPRKSGGG